MLDCSLQYRDISNIGFKRERRRSSYRLTIITLLKHSDLPSCRNLDILTRILLSIEAMSGSDPKASDARVVSTEPLVCHLLNSLSMSKPI